VLPRLVDQYDVVIQGRTVPVSPHRPDSERQRHHSLVDAALLASLYGLELPLAPPAPRAAAGAAAVLVEAEDADYLATAREVGRALWGGEPFDRPDATARLAQNRALQHRLGHYDAGMLHYAGEWFWGLDRLPILESRLAAVGAGTGTTLPIPVDPPPAPARGPLEMWLSVRSPYSYVALDRVLAMARAHERELILRPVLPMVMRGLPVPRIKRTYLLLDAAREAHRHGVPFGRICDPVGVGVERVLAVYFALGERQIPFLRAALTSIWSEGVDVATDAGLRRITDACSIDWQLATTALRYEGWRDEVEINRRALLDAGLWGVPCFRIRRRSATEAESTPSLLERESRPTERAGAGVDGKIGEFTTWGQDRIWVLDRMLGQR
jgi:2-hydroxychromene-2-carboxylate isomerase